MKRITFYLIVLLVISCKTNTSNSIGGRKVTIDEGKKSIHPKRVNQKFYTSFGDGDTLTVKSFSGGTGIAYPTYEEAVWNNGGNERVLIRNKEYGGLSEWSKSYLFENEDVEEEFSPLHENYGVNQLLLKSIWENILSENYKEVIDKGISEDLIDIEELKMIGELVKLRSKVVWKLNMKRVDANLVKYSLFAYPPRFYGDPVFPPFIELETSIDNSISPNRISSFRLKLENEIDMAKFEEIGVNPKYIGKE